MGIGILIFAVGSLIYKGRRRARQIFARCRNKISNKDQNDESNKIL